VAAAVPAVPAPATYRIEALTKIKKRIWDGETYASP